LAGRLRMIEMEYWNFGTMEEWLIDYATNDRIE
jgi:hypothetical protein